jgi:hypothetical protein
MDLMSYTKSGHEIEKLKALSELRNKFDKSKNFKAQLKTQIMKQVNEIDLKTLSTLPPIAQDTIRISLDTMNANENIAPEIKQTMNQKIEEGQPVIKAINEAVNEAKLQQLSMLRTYADSNDLQNLLNENAHLEVLNNFMKNGATNDVEALIAEAEVFMDNMDYEALPKGAHIASTFRLLNQDTNIMNREVYGHVATENEFNIQTIIPEGMTMTNMYGMKFTNNDGKPLTAEQLSKAASGFGNIQHYSDPSQLAKTIFDNLGMNIDPDHINNIALNGNFMVLPTDIADGIFEAGSDFLTDEQRNKKLYKANS